MSDSGQRRPAVRPPLTGGAKSADRALAVLDLLAEAGGSLPTAEIIARCGIPKSSAHQLLNVMRDRGYVTHNPVERTWGLGEAVLALAGAYRRSDELQLKAGPFLVGLAGDTSCTAHLAVLRGTDVLYLDKREPKNNSIRLVTEIGARLPAAMSAVGQAILAFRSSDELRERYQGYRFEGTNGGPVSLDELVSRLAQVARRGVAQDPGMITQGVVCIAAPVFGTRKAVGALGISMISAQQSEERLAAVEQRVSTAARLLTEELRGTAPDDPPVWHPIREPA